MLLGGLFENAMEYEMEYAVDDDTEDSRVSHNRLPDCPGATNAPCRATKSFAICL